MKETQRQKEKNNYIKNWQQRKRQRVERRRDNKKTRAKAKQICTMHGATGLL